MCGRFTQLTLPGILTKATKAKVKLDPFFLLPHFNIPPSTVGKPETYVPVIRIPYQETVPVLEALKWGLVPLWASDPNVGYSMTNAVGEEIEAKPSYRKPFKEKRCLVPVDGFYEWVQTAKPKQPYYFTMKDDKPFALAGIWEYWEPKAGGEPITSFSLITIGPNSVVAKVHDRMPVVLGEKDYAAWLDPKNNDVDKLKKLLKPYPAAKMQAYPVSTFMSNTKNQGPECVKPLKA